MVSPDEPGFSFQGADCFDAKLNLEVQWTCEEAIAAVEARGGVITSAYYDIFSVKAMVDPTKFFQSGQPIPKRLTPPAAALGYYADAANRGYLADPRRIAEERLVLAQKYGYELPDVEADPDRDMLLQSKDPRQGRKDGRRVCRRKNGLCIKHS